MGRRPQKRRTKPASRPGSVTIYGFHAVREALANPAREVSQVHATEPAARRIERELQGRGLRPEFADTRDLDRLAGPDAVHQGLAIEASPLPPGDLAALLGRDGPSVLLVLDQITDPRNVGAILRLAAAFAVEAVVVTRHHRPQETGVLAKAASGGLEHVPICETGNLVRAIEQIRDAGYFVVGLDSQGEAKLGDIAGDARTALVLGAEGAGLRRLTREHCDRLARIELPGAITSVNVATAAALALQTLRFHSAGSR